MRPFVCDLVFPYADFHTVWLALEERFPLTKALGSAKDCRAKSAECRRRADAATDPKERARCLYRAKLWEQPGSELDGPSKIEEEPGRVVKPRLIEIWGRLAGCDAPGEARN